MKKMTRAEKLAYSNFLASLDRSSLEYLLQKYRRAGDAQKVGMIEEELRIRQAVKETDIYMSPSGEIYVTYPSGEQHKYVASVDEEEEKAEVKKKVW